MLSDPGSNVIRACARSESLDVLDDVLKLMEKRPSAFFGECVRTVPSSAIVSTRVTLVEIFRSGLKILGDSDNDTVPVEVGRC